MPTTQTAARTSEGFSAEAFLEFVRSKPATQRYDWSNKDTCALAQFGFPGELGLRGSSVPVDVYLAAVAHSDCTWHALATRLEAALAEKSL